MKVDHAGKVVAGAPLKQLIESEALQSSAMAGEAVATRPLLFDVLLEQPAYL